jgi:hypothetical protein
MHIHFTEVVYKSSTVPASSKLHIPPRRWKTPRRKMQERLERAEPTNAKMQFGREGKERKKSNTVTKRRRRRRRAMEDSYLWQQSR